jgi:hypothetical protein
MEEYHEDDAMLVRNAMNMKVSGTASPKQPGKPTPSRKKRKTRTNSQA